LGIAGVNTTPFTRKTLRTFFGTFTTTHGVGHTFLLHTVWALFYQNGSFYKPGFLTNLVYKTFIGFPGDLVSGLHKPGNFFFGRGNKISLFKHFYYGTWGIPNGPLI